MEIPKSILFVLTLSLANFRYLLTQRGVSPEYLDNLLKFGKYTKFADILQIPNVHLVDPSYRKTDFLEQFFYNGLKLGDIMLRPGQLLNPDEMNNFNGNLRITIKTWNNGIIPYYISNNTISEDERNNLQKEIQLNNDKFGPNVVFRPYQKHDVNYVFMFSGGCGYYTNLGMVGGPQAISLPPHILNGLLSHDFQHVLGFGHENNRHDRDKYVRLRPENINEVLMPFYIKYTSDSLVNLGPYDYYACVAYQVNVPASNRTAIEVLQDGIDETVIGINGTITTTDIQRVKLAYPIQ